ncbi:MAG: DUF1080 domain-containing protein [Bacteroidales bacterium]|nr:DUF1080 domain-containing protein [Bacteroidales bacterium]
MKIYLSAIAVCATALPLIAQTGVTVDASAETGRIPALIYGAGAEDVNHEIYGGLYDQRIFGESFEEPTTALVKDFISYDNAWTVEEDVLRLYTTGHGKIVFQGNDGANLTAEVEMRIDSPKAITGFITNVSDAGDGADAFRGYEIGFNAGSRHLVIGKHEHNWQPKVDEAVDIEPGEWNKLRVEYNGAKVTVYLNGEKIREFEDTDNPLTSGMIGLRSYDGSASFRNLSVNGTPVTFESMPTGVNGFRHYDYHWTVADNELSTTTPGHAKIIYQSNELGKGAAEVALRHDGSRAISGLIFDVSEAREGADNFRGYEISLNAENRNLVIGKHDHNWESLANIPVNFTPSDWNRLRVDFDGANFTVSLNGEQVYTGSDSKNPLMRGKIGLRTFDGPASFKNFTINEKEIAVSQMPVGVSPMWEPIGNGTYSHENSGACHGEYYQKISGNAGDGIANSGLNKWGIGIEQGKKMSGYVYLKGDTDKAYVALRNADGSEEYARKEISGISASEWNRFDFELTPSATDADARFVVALGDDGSLGVDMAMLRTDSFPFRDDITEAFRQEGLTFLRYGGTMINAAEYMTGNMMGPEDQRPPYIGHWYRNSTNGFGIIEFVQFARMLNTEPTFAINIEDNPADVLALLKELEPYNLKYIEIGNEENLTTDARDAYEHYVERFHILYDAIHAVYPDLVFINAAWWRGDNEDLMEYVFHELDGKSELWDYHPWTDEVSQAKAIESDLNNMKRLFNKWNPESTMHVAILEENGNTHSLHRALSHAIVLNVVRRMNGFVELDSPANALEPYLQNDNGWNQGQIFFNSSEVWCQPPYYAQQMAAAHHQPVLLNPSFRNANLNMTATRNEDGTRIVFHIVNSSSREQSVKLNIENAGSVKSINGVSLSNADLGARNTPRNPECVVPSTFTLNEPTVSLAPYSYTVVELECDGLNGVENIVSNNASIVRPATYYNMGGIQVSHPTEGLFITDSGKKIAL